MSSSNIATKILRQLAKLVNRVRPSDFSRSSNILGRATIWQRASFTSEFFQRFQAVLPEDGHRKNRSTGSGTLYVDNAGFGTAVSNVRHRHPVKPFEKDLNGDFSA